MSSPSYHPHDRFFRSAFEHSHLVREYLTQFLPGELSDHFNYETLQQEKESFLDKNLKEHFSDVVYTCEYGKTPIRVAILFEHKSYIPAFPWLQLLRYLLNAFEAQIQQESFSGKLTPVIPVIVYHGEREWKIRKLGEFFDGTDIHIHQFLPDFTYLLTDLSQYSEEALMSMEGSWVKNAFLALKVSRQQNIFDWLGPIFSGLDLSIENERSANFIYRIIVYLFETGIPKADVMDAIKNLTEPAKEKVMTIYETILRQGREEGIEEGHQEKNFEVFKNGIPLKIEIKTLQQLTGVSDRLAKSWKLFLEKNPKAEFSDWKRSDE